MKPIEAGSGKRRGGDRRRRRGNGRRCRRRRNRGRCWDGRWRRRGRGRWGPWWNGWASLQWAAAAWAADDNAVWRRGRRRRTRRLRARATAGNTAAAGGCDKRWACDTARAHRERIAHGVQMFEVDREVVGNSEALQRGNDARTADIGMHRWKIRRMKDRRARVFSKPPLTCGVALQGRNDVRVVHRGQERLRERAE